MKLLLENFRKYLNEEDKGGNELYHATLSGEDDRNIISFSKDGIDSGRALGHGQGAGFYLFRDIGKARKHARDLVAGGQIDLKEVPVVGKPIVVVVDEPVTPENFDIDYEIFAYGFAQFIKQNLDYFSKNDQALGLGRRAGKGVSHFQGRPLIRPNKKLLGLDIARTIQLDPPEGTASLGRSAADGETLSKIAGKLAEFDPVKFKEFEVKFLSDATAIKYNGKKKIWPLRIEDLEGNILWSR